METWANSSRHGPIAQDKVSGFQTSASRRELFICVLQNTHPVIGGESVFLCSPLHTFQFSLNAETDKSLQGFGRHWDPSVHALPWVGTRQEAPSRGRLKRCECSTRVCTCVPVVGSSFRVKGKVPLAWNKTLTSPVSRKKKGKGPTRLFGF